MQARDVLFSKTQQRVLFALFASDTAEPISYAELLRRAGGGSGAIHRELMQFVAAGLVLQKASGGRRVYCREADHPACAEIRALARKLAPRPGSVKSAKSGLDPLIGGALAKKYMWWKKPAEALLDQDRLTAQVMNLGTLADIQTISEQLGEDYLRKVLTRADAGCFEDRSWTYWHYRLGLARPGRVPPPPRRRIP